MEGHNLWVIYWIKLKEERLVGKRFTDLIRSFKERVIRRQVKQATFYFYFILYRVYLISTSYPSTKHLLTLPVWSTIPSVFNRLTRTLLPCSELRSQICKGVIRKSSYSNSGKISVSPSGTNSGAPFPSTRPTRRKD